MKINIGSYKERIKGYKNLDVLDLPEVDIVHDLREFPYPFKDNSVDAIRARCVLEHLPLETTQPLLEELCRICKPGAEVYIEVPHEERWMDFPDHKRGFSIGFFMTICKSSDVLWNFKGKFALKTLSVTPYGLGHFLPHAVRKRLCHLVKGISYTIQATMVVVK